VTPLTVIVPMRDQLPVTRKLLACLAEQTRQPEQIVILDNGSTGKTAAALERIAAADARVEVEDCQGMTIYEAWNRGFLLARREWETQPASEFHVLVTNNDVTFPAWALAAMGAALDAASDRAAAYPDFQSRSAWKGRSVDPSPACEETRGVWGSGGMLGFCFMLAGHRIGWRPLVQDLTYRWWYGDNHLARSIELAGLKQVKVTGLPILHQHEATAKHYDLAEAKRLDREHWEVVTGQRPLRQRPPTRGARVVPRQWSRRPPTVPGG